MFRIALANIKFPTTREESVTLAQDAIADAGAERADVVCFPECFVPGYRGMGKQVAPPDAAFLENAWSNIATSAANANVAVVRPDGTLLCYQPYGKEGLLVADIDITAATGLLAARLRD